MKEANKIIFDFVWKGTDKVKRSTLIGDIEEGGIKAPHLNSTELKHKEYFAARNWQMINRVDGKQSFCIIRNLLRVN